MNCPDRQQLRQYLLGDVAERDQRVIAEHVDQCAACVSTLDVLDGVEVDTLVSHLRLPVSAEGADADAEFQALAAKLNAITLEAPDVPPVPSELGSIREYELIEQIGQGGMGTVYKAWHSRLRRTVALKVLPAERMSDASAVERFDREMEAVGRLDHPHIVRALDAGEHENMHYLVMEYIDGVDLSALSRRCGRLSISNACELVRQVAVGLQYAHEHQLVHRDVKPSNLLLTHQGRVKVLDLGLALLRSSRPAEDELTTTGQVMGTLDYMAPEQTRDTHHVDIRADIYSLGCTLYRLLSGQPPFSGPAYRSAFDKMLAHKQQPVPSLDQHRRDVPTELVAVLQRMLAKDPDERFATPAEVADALTPFAARADLVGLLEAVQEDAPTRIATDQPPSATQSPISSRLTDTDVPRPAKKPLPTAAARGTGRGRLIASLVIGFLLIAFGSIVYINTGRGQLEIAVNVPDVKVTVDGKQPMHVEISSPRDKILITIPDVPAGRHVMQVTKDGFTTQTESFYVFRNGKQELTAVLKPLIPQRTDAAITFNASKPWPLGPVENVLTGLVARPTSLPGLKRWQAETAAPRGLVLSVAWSPDEKLIACGTEIGQVRIYEAATWRLVRVLWGQTKVYAVAWNPAGTQLASASYDGTTRLWDADGRPGPVLEHKGYVHTVAWSPDGRRLATGTSGRKVHLWQADGTAGPILEGHSGIVRSVAWSPDGTQIASAGDDQTVRLWNANGTLIEQLNGHTAAIRSVAWSPDGKRLASGSFDSTVRLWDANGTAEDVLEGHTGYVEAVAWSPDGQWLASVDNTGAGVGFVRLWNPDGSPGPLFKTDRSTFSLAWSPDSRKVVVGTEIGLRLFQTDGRQQPALVRHRFDISTLAWSPDGTRLAAGAQHPVVRLWSADGTPGAVLKGNQARPVIFVNGLSWHPGGERLASVAAYDYAVRQWSVDGTAEPSLRAAEGAFWTVAWNPQGTLLAAGAAKTIQLWDADGKPQPSIDFDEADIISALTWAPDGAWLAAGARNGKVGLFQPNGTPGPVLETYPNLLSLGWSPDGTRLAVGGQGFGIWMRDRRDELAWERFFDAGYQGSYTHSLDWSDDGKQIARTNHYKIEVSDRDGGEPRIFEGSFGFIVAWSPRGDELAFAARESGRPIEIWNAVTGRPVRTIVALKDDQSLTLSAAGELLKGDADVVDREIVYLVETTDGGRQTLTAAEFRRRLEAAAKANTTKAAAAVWTGPLEAPPVAPANVPDKDQL